MDKDKKLAQLIAAFKRSLTLNFAENKPENIIFVNVWTTINV